MDDQNGCDGSAQCPATEHILGCFTSSPETEDMIDRAAESTISRRSTR